MKSIKSLVDEYAEITRQIKALEPKQAALAEQIKAKGVGRYEGTAVALQVTPVAGRKTTNWQGVCVLKLVCRLLLSPSIPPKVRTPFASLWCCE